MSTEPVEDAPPTEESERDGPSPDELPSTTGTVFIMILFLMAMAAMWGLMYMTLLGR